MENDSYATPVNFSLEEQTYTTVLQGQTGTSTDLPAFQSRGDALSQWWKNMEDSINQWFSETFKKSGFDGVDFSWVDKEFIVNFLSLFLWLTLAALVFYLIWNYFLSRQGDPTAHVQIDPTKIRSREQALVKMIEEMMANQQWTIASKLRWRLFLERNGLSQEITPKEYETMKKKPVPNSKDQYQHMFAQGQSNEDWFKEYNRKLRDLEKAP